MIRKKVGRPHINIKREGPFSNRLQVIKILNRFFTLEFRFKIGGGWVETEPISLDTVDGSAGCHPSISAAYVYSCGRGSSLVWIGLVLLGFVGLGWVGLGWVGLG